MSYVLLVFGLVFLAAGVRNTQQQLFTLLKGDLTGPGNYTYWMLAVFAIGAIGYIPAARKLANSFLALIIIAVAVSPKGSSFFSLFTSQIQAGTAQANTANGTGSQAAGGIQPLAPLAPLPSLSPSILNSPLTTPGFSGY